MSEPRPITGAEREPLAFTIATLMTKPGQYREMVSSFQNAGFDGTDTEYLYVDNSRGNTLDGYSGLAALIAAARGRHIILVHQDLLLLADGRAELEARLAELDRRDPDWALAGNAGSAAPGSPLVRISDPHGDDQRIGALPAQAQSLDENFIVLKRRAMLSPSRGLSGFHLYGTDLCLQARLKGMTAYVIDFHLRHLGGGTRDQSFIAARDALERAYATRLKGGLLETTCDLLVVAPSGRRLLLGRLLRKPLRRWLGLRHAKARSGGAGTKR